MTGSAGEVYGARRTVSSNIQKTGGRSGRGVIQKFEWADRWQNPGHSVRSSSAASTGRILTKPKLAEADGQTS